MAKVEIDVPNGKVADVKKEGDKVIVTFKDINILDRIKTFEDVVTHLVQLEDEDVDWAYQLMEEYRNTVSGSYSEAVTKYRMVVAALTNNEELSMTQGDLYYPFVQFCKERKKRNCYGDTVVGEVNIDGTIYEIVGGSAYDGSYAGLGYFASGGGVSSSYAYIGFRSVSSRKVAEHISKHFGRLVFEVMYGGTNCAWRWID